MQQIADWLEKLGMPEYFGRGSIVTERPEAELAEIERWRTQTPGLRA
jgi:hypothetical protein